MNELEKALKLLNKEDFDNSNIDFHDELSLNEYIINNIKSNLYSTISIKYELGEVFVTSVYSSGTKLEIFKNYNEDSFNDFCKNILSLDINEKYNCSRTINVEGIKTRIYALMPPFTKTPNITISTTKLPPEILDKQTISDEVFDEIIHSNFIIAGASGSGKTYLFNYLLNKFIRKDERIALIEEFGELIAPNNLVTSVLVPPPKPGENSLLKFVTEQSNLMRLDAIYVGEIKSGEAWPFVVNLASGTRGGCTIHGESAAQALSRLRALCRLSCDNDEAINDFIAKSIKYIIVMKNKNIEQIYKLTGTYLKNNFAMKEISS